MNETLKTLLDNYNERIESIAILLKHELYDNESALRILDTERRTIINVIVGLYTLDAITESEYDRAFDEIIEINCKLTKIIFNHYTR